MSVLHRLLQHASGNLQGAELLASEGDYVGIYRTRCVGGALILWGPALFRKTLTNHHVSLIQVLRIYAICSESKQSQKLQALIGWLEGSPSSHQPWHIFGPPLKAFETWQDQLQTGANLLPLQVAEKDLLAPMELDSHKRRISLGQHKKEELQVAVSSSSIRKFMEVVGGDRLTEEEKNAGSADTNSLVIGRSGTGKTTVAMLRLAALELLRPETASTLPAIFLTASPVLSREVLRSFKSLKQVPGLRRRLRAAGLLRARVAVDDNQQVDGDEGTGGDHCQTDAGTLQTDTLDAQATSILSGSLKGNSRGSARSSSKRSRSDCGPGSLGSWFALDSVQTEESFQMVEAEVYGFGSEDDDEAPNDDGNSVSESEAELENENNMAEFQGEPHLDDDDDKSENSDSDIDDWTQSGLPPSLTMATRADFPMFVTVRQLLHMMDASLSQPFFARGADMTPVDVDVCSWQPEGGGKYVINDWMAGKKWQPQGIREEMDDLDDDGADDLMRLDHSRREDAPRGRIEVQYEYFAQVMWSKIVSCGQNFEASLVWTEIMTHIKGSNDALQNGGRLSRAQYVGELGRKKTPMTPTQRHHIYDIFEAYDKQNKAMAFDEADFVYHIYRHIRAEGYKGPPLPTIFIDEAQDISQATIQLLLEVTEAQRGGIFISGDPAQAISKGLAFRLCDLRSTFLQGPRCSKHDAPNVLRLTQNFRCAPPVLHLANGVLGLLQTFFPNALDHGLQESPTDGMEGRHASASQAAPMPQCITSLQALLKDIIVGQPSEGEAPPFGANLVLLVREQAQKKFIPELLQHCLVMTIWEAKGLEFDTVILVNFFDEVQGDWQMISSSGTEQGRQAPSGWDANSHALLCVELKQLYVAITRAKRRVIFFDNATARNVPLKRTVSVLLDTWLREFIVQSEAPAGDDGDAGASAQAVVGCQSSELEECHRIAWREQGRKLLRLGFADQAELCFSWSGDESLRREAEATKLAKQAAMEKAKIANNLNSADQDEENNPMLKFLKAAELFDGCGRTAHAGKCLAAADRWEEAADHFATAQRWSEAAAAFLKAGRSSNAADCYERGGQWIKALQTWEKIGDSSQVLRIASVALAERGALREQTLGFVRRAVQTLPDTVAIRAAVNLLGSLPQDSSDAELGEFLCGELGAEVAALKFLKPEGPRRLEVTLCAFHRSFAQGHALWEVIPQRQTDSGATDMETLLSVLYGLNRFPEGHREDPFLAGQITEPSVAPRIADWKSIHKESALHVRASALRFLIDAAGPDKPKSPGDNLNAKVKSQTETSFSSMVETFSRAALSDSAVLYYDAGASQLPLTNTVTLSLLQRKRAPCGMQLFGNPLSKAKYAFAPSDELLAALQTQAVEAAVRLALKAPGTAEEKLRRVMTIPHVPKQSLHVAAERFAFQVWNTQGPCSKPPVHSEMVPVLLSAAQTAWKDGKPGAQGVNKFLSMQDRSGVERAFILLRCTEEARSCFLELPGAKCHARLVDYCSFLEEGALCSAAWALEEYLESAPQVSYNFCVELASYLAGPCAAALGGGTKRAYVLTSLAWDWTENLSDGAGLMEPLSLILEGLESRSPSCGDSALPLHIMVEAQVRYSLGQILDPTWRQACDDVWETDGCLAAGGPVLASGIAARAKVNASQACSLYMRSKRRWAAVQIRRWWKKQMLTRRSLQPIGLWKVLQRTSEVLCGLSSVQPARAAQLILLAKSVLESSADTSSTASTSAIAALWEAGNAAAAEEKELWRRQQGLLQQEEIERGRVAREQKREAKRLRGLKKNRALQRKAEALKLHKKA
eukprot:gnl/MRDRNA2_/MRDRNA2_29022_c0_seq1.p1 gnl/MRDRNA2_/MRDRNA2_29022_c0~~gnl/MRDRNA2_/MRDRNA2_29022_c0_seq1.p1  ORF type:complete len:1957 (+),score=399.04 gnl/MRDRNA2_/MRDRNA2_29022_c0_seq1:483-5873(+)